MLDHSLGTFLVEIAQILKLDGQLHKASEYAAIAANAQLRRQSWVSVDTQAIAAACTHTC